MRRFSFQKAATVDDEAEEEEEDEDYYYSRISAAAVRPRRSFHRSSSVLSVVGSRKSFCYDKLSQVPVQLVVVKLDGSSFEIDVRKTATIAEVKQAVEIRFSHLPTEGPGKISWRHVWGHFCLSYRGQKLLNDSDCIKNYDIKDGDQLRFVRHMSIAYNLIKKRSRKLIQAPKPHTIPEIHEEENRKLDVYDDLEYLRCQQYKYEKGGAPKIRKRRWTFKMGKWIRWLL